MVIAVAGCAGPATIPVSGSPDVTVSESTDPILGSWMTIGDSTLYYVFRPKGYFSSGELKSPGLTLVGKWERVKENEYLITIDGTAPMTIIYVPNGDYIYDNIMPAVHATRYAVTPTSK